jgi:hypothetical protein
MRTGAGWRTKALRRGTLLVPGTSADRTGVLDPLLACFTTM